MVNDKLAKVRAEIERKRNRHSKAKRIESALEDNTILFYIDSLQEEPVSEDLIDFAKQYVKEHVIGIDEITFSIATDMFISGINWHANWQKNHFWKPADGDDLPEYERDVVVFTQNFPDDAGMMKVAIGHRHNSDGWDGKSITTGNVEHYTSKTYDKGGWNIPDVKYWLDCSIPKK